MRIVVSLTTIPDRINEIDTVIDHLLTLGFDMVHLNVPHVSLRGGKPYIIPSSLVKLPNFQINRCTDYGPITKLLPTLECEVDPETYIVTCDDDVLFNKNILSYIKTKIQQYPESVLSFTGVCIGSFPFYYQLNHDCDSPLDLIEGVSGVIYKRSLLDVNQMLDFLNHSVVKKELILNDDHWISGYLGYKEIPKICIYSPDCKHYKSNQHNVSALSSRKLSLIKEHFKLFNHFKKKGYYQHSSRWYKSIGMVIVSSVLLVCILLFLLISKIRKP